MERFVMDNPGFIIPVALIVVWVAVSIGSRFSACLLRKVRHFFVAAAEGPAISLGRTLFLILLLLPLLSSCSHDQAFTLSSASGDKVLVANDSDTIERIIDCGIAKDCDHLSLRELLAQGKVFFVDGGTRVVMSDGFTLSGARKVRVLEGKYAGRTGWVYERMVS